MSTRLDLHEFFLSTSIVTSMRAAKTREAVTLADRASGAAAAWAAHRLLAKLAEVAPKVAAEFADELSEELEMASYGDEMGDAAIAMGLPAQEWIAAEFARQDALAAAPATEDGAQPTARYRDADGTVWEHTGDREADGSPLYAEAGLTPVRRNNSVLHGMTVDEIEHGVGTLVPVLDSTHEAFDSSQVSALAAAPATEDGAR